MLAHNLTFTTNVEEGRQLYNNLLSYISVIENSWVEGIRIIWNFRWKYYKYILNIVYLTGCLCNIYIYIYIKSNIYIYIYIYNIYIKTAGVVETSWKIDYLLTKHMFYFNIFFLFIHCIKQLTDLTCVLPNACS